MAAEELLDELRDPGCYGAAVQAVQIVQTHLSVVCLTDELVFKLKKACTLPFVDFAPLENRRAACRDEVRLNRRLCPDVYLGTAALRRLDGSLRFAPIGDDEHQDDLDVAVVMRRLPQERMLDVLLADSVVEAAQIGELAEDVARFHENAERGPEIDALGDPARLATFARNNFTELAMVRGAVSPPALLAATRHASETAFARILPTLRARLAAGRVVDGHGDLHARNICMTAPPTIYDCIEFEPAFRRCDVATEVAFLVMDLRYRGADELARAFVQSYVAASGDEQLPDLLPVLTSYRAMVRAKVSALQVHDHDIEREERRHARLSTRAHLQLAAGCLLEAGPARWIVLCGPPASGKSVVARHLARVCRWPHITTDIERKRMAGIPSHHRAAEEHYTPWFSQRTYEAVFEAARQAQRAGHPIVLLDGNFATRARRAEVSAAALASGASTTFVHVQVDVATATLRAARRCEQAQDPSDAGVDVTLQRHREFEMPFDDEGDVLRFDGTRLPDEIAGEALTALLDATYADSGVEVRSALS